MRNIPHKTKGRSLDGKVFRHHWFKNCRVALRMAIEQRRESAEAKRIREAKKGAMYTSIRELFRRGGRL